MPEDKTSELPVFAALDDKREMVQSILYNMYLKSDEKIAVAVDLLYAMREATKPKADSEEDGFALAVRFVMTDVETSLFGDFLDEP